MRSHLLFATIISLFTALSTARIYGIAVPSTIAPGSTFRVTILTQDYIQSVQDVAMAFGLAPTPNIATSSLGTLLDSKYLGPDDSNIVTNITHIVQIPDGLATGPIIFTAALFSLLGADYESSVENFSVNVTVGDFTGGELVSSVPAA